MYKTLFIFVFCLSSSSAKADWLVNYQEQTRSGVGRVELNLQVLMPAGKMPADVLLIVNSSAGRNDNVMQALGKQAQTQGIAAVLLDTYGPRGINDTMSKQNQLSYTQQLADIFAALNAMRNDPRFKDRKIALAGHSRGGILTYMLAHQDFAAFWEEPILAFDAFVALSPDCLPTFPSQLITAPLFIVSGENDDWTRPAPCLRHVAQMQALGQTAQMLLIPGANHSFSSKGYFFGRFLKFACPLDRDYFYVRRETVGQALLLQDSAQKEPETDAQMWRRCAGPSRINGRGASAGGEADKLPLAIMAALGFLQGLGWGLP
jgi:dienelactone hydrolase